MKKLFAFILFLSVISSPMALSAPEDRFKGASYDGHAKSIVVEVAIPPSPTVILVR